MKLLFFIPIICFLASCWPSSVSFVDGSMPDEWKNFSVKTLENNAANAPISYAVTLSEDIKDGIQNKTKLKLNTAPNSGEVQIEGVISSYTISPIAIQSQDEAAKNRLTVSTAYTIYIKAPKEEEMTLTSTRFADYTSDQDFSIVEAELIAEINKQIVQDIINKLLSNW